MAVSALGDASNLTGGTLLVTPLLAADGDVYAVAQGALATGAIAAGGAAGVTVLMDRLLELKPAHVPGAVFWAGFDAAFAEIVPGRPDPAFRQRLGLAASDLVAVYTGNVHNSNVAEARSLVKWVLAQK